METRGIPHFADCARDEVLGFDALDLRGDQPKISAPSKLKASPSELRAS
jgi:hypothetical protein